jgi:hypothetical protein
MPAGSSSRVMRGVWGRNRAAADQRRRARRPEREAARRDGAVALDRVARVLLAVGDVVQEVDAARGEAEGDEEERDRQERAGVAQLPGEIGEEDPHEDREVLRPLMGAQRLQERRDRDSSRWDERRDPGPEGAG